MRGTPATTMLNSRMAKSVDDRIRRSRVLLGNPYAYLNGEGDFEALFPEDRDIHADRLRLGNQYAHLEELEGVGEGLLVGEQPRGTALIDPGSLCPGQHGGHRYSRREIDEIVRKLQVALWRNRAKLYGEADPLPLQVVDPEIGLRALGFAVDTDDPLDEYLGTDRVYRVAGVMDRADRRVMISGHLDLLKKRFTTAHELGHAVLHTDMTGLHRDRALDGSAPQAHPIETEANRFAAAFLMPDKLVRQAFREAFGTETFALDEESAFGLGLGRNRLASIKQKYATRRDLARLVASADHFHGREFKPLAAQFRVAAEAMAIRLEELGLV